MLGQKEVLNITKWLKLPVSESSLRNYIREELCLGALETKNGISKRGYPAFYPMQTAVEAAVAKDMLKKNGRRLEFEHVRLARRQCLKMLQLMGSEPCYIMEMEQRCDNTRKKSPISTELMDELVYEWIFKFCKFYFAVVTCSYESMPNSVVLLGYPIVILEMKLWGFVEKLTVQFDYSYEYTTNHSNDLVVDSSQKSMMFRGEKYLYE